MIPTRRVTSGVAIVTTAARAASVRQRYDATGLVARVLVVQDGPSWPAHRPPVILDTIGLPVAILIGLLVNAPPAPLFALADRADWRTLRLLGLCGAVRLIAPDDALVTCRWMHYLQGTVAAQASARTRVWILPAPPPLPLDPLLLPILAALPSSSSYAAAAACCPLSTSTLYRVLRVTRLALGLPAGTLERFGPPDLARLILDRLGMDSPRPAHVSGSTLLHTSE